MQRIVLAMLLVVAISGCQQHSAVMIDPDGNAVATYNMNSFLQDAVQWIIPGVLLILGSAAFLHWRLTLRASLLVLAIAAVLMALGVIAGQVGERPMWGATLDEIASGRRAPIQWLMTARQLLAAIGFILAGVGGVMALVSGVRQVKTTNTGPV
jgi:uncharacterized protein YceK